MNYSFAEKVLFEHYGKDYGALLTRDTDAGFSVSYNSFTDVTVRFFRYTFSVWKAHKPPVCSYE